MLFLPLEKAFTSALVISDARHAILAGECGIQWIMSSFLKRLDYVDDICLLSHRITESNGSRSANGDKQKPNETKDFSLTGHSTLSICINRQNIKAVEQFLYLRIVVSADSSTELDAAQHIRCHCNHAKSAFAVSSKIWVGVCLIPIWF